MIILSIENSISNIQGLNDKQFNILKSLLSYKIDDQTTFFSNSFHRNIRYLMDKRGFFPTGLLYVVQKFLKDLKLPVNVRDHRKRPGPLESFPKLSLPFSPYLEQIAAAEACRRANRGIVVAPTGLGKSVIAALIIEKLRVKTLIVVPTLELKRQLTADLTSYFDSESAFTVENVDALDLKKKALGYGAVIIDEFHHSAAKTYRELNKKCWNDIYYRFGMTATPFRSKDNERLLLESVLSEVVYRIEHKDAVAKGYIVPVEAYYLEVPRSNKTGNTWASIYSSLVVNNEARNKIIRALLQSLKDFPTLCLVKEINHGERLKELAGVEFANGKNENTRQYILEFNLQERKQLIGTNGILGEGVDTKPAEYIIIAGLGKSKNAFMQQCGRGFRKYPEKISCKIFIFCDNSHKWTRAHFRAQVKYLREEYGIEPIKIYL